MARAKIDQRREQTEAGAPASQAGQPSSPNAENDIALRAFDLYLARGRQDGHDVDDWLQAERELHGDRPAAQ